MVTWLDGEVDVAPEFVYENSKNCDEPGMFRSRAADVPMARKGENGLSPFGT